MRLSKNSFEAIRAMGAVSDFRYASIRAMGTVSNFRYAAIRAMGTVSDIRYAAIWAVAAVCVGLSSCGGGEKDEPEPKRPINERFYGKWECQTEQIDVQFEIKRDGNIYGTGSLTREKKEAYEWQYRFSGNGNVIDATGTVRVRSGDGREYNYLSKTTFELRSDGNMTGGPVSGLVYVPYVVKPRQNIGPTVCPDEHHPHALDMGYSDNVLWACCNLGARSPWETGSYYAWGETEPKEVFVKETYRLWEDEAEGVMADLGLDIAGGEHDAATANLGEGWQLPSVELMHSLMQETDNSWVNVGGVNGRMFTGRNGGVLFIPAAGYINGSGQPFNAGNEARVWCSNGNQFERGTAFCYQIFQRQGGPGLYDRSFGLSIRPVYVIKKVE